MKRILCLFFLSLLIGGCGAKPAPVWYAAGHKLLETYKKDFLTGAPPSVAELHFKRAVEEIAKSGDLNLLGKAWLTRIALQVSALEEADESDYRKIEAALQVSENRNFYLFLKGDPAAVDGALLPAQYRPFLAALRSGDVVNAEQAISAMEDDPLSRLIAAGVAWRNHLENEAILQAAVETASRNGWKKPLLAWLERLKTFLESRGDAARADAVHRRIDLIAP